jgi:hypothetical protein
MERGVEVMGYHNAGRLPVRSNGELLGIGDRIK